MPPSLPSESFDGVSDDAGLTNGSEFDAVPESREPPTKKRRTKKPIANQSSKLNFAFVLTDSNVNLQDGVTHDKWAQSSSCDPQYGPNICAITGIVLYQWSFRHNDDPVYDVDSLQLQKQSMRTSHKRRRNVCGILEYKACKSFRLTVPIPITRGEIEAPKLHAHKWCQQLQRDTNCYFADTDGQNLQQLCDQHDADLPNSGFRLSSAHSELIFKDVVSSIQCLAIPQRGFKTLGLQPSQPTFTNLKKWLAESRARDTAPAPQNSRGDTTHLLELPPGTPEFPQPKKAFGVTSVPYDPCNTLKYIKFANNLRNLEKADDTLEAAIDCVCTEEELLKRVRDNKPKLLKNSTAQGSTPTGYRRQPDFPTRVPKHFRIGPRQHCKHTRLL